MAAAALAEAAVEEAIRMPLKPAPKEMVGRKQMAKETEVAKVAGAAVEVSRGAQGSAGPPLRWTGGLRPLARRGRPQALVRGFAGIQLPVIRLL